MIFNTIGFGVFAGIYHWFPKFTGRMYYEGLGKVHFVLTFIGATLNWLPLHWAGLLGCRAGSRLTTLNSRSGTCSAASVPSCSALPPPFILNMVSSGPGPQAPPTPGEPSAWNGCCPHATGRKLRRRHPHRDQ